MITKKTILRTVFSFILFLPLVSHGQIDLSAKLVNTRTLQYEAIDVYMRIQNNMAEPLILGGDDGNATLDFEVEQSPGIPVARTDRPILSQPLVIEPGEAKNFAIDLLPAYRVQTTGPYTVRPRITAYNRSFETPKLYLDIVSGLEIKKLLAGVPGLPGAMRTYSLRTVGRDRSQYAFLRIDDEDADLCYGVISLGRIVRLYEPVIRVDGEGNVHVLHQAGPSQFSHTAFTPYGLPVEQEQFNGDGSPMRLERTQNGGVSVTGGNAYKGAEEGSDGEVVEFEDLVR